MKIVDTTSSPKQHRNSPGQNAHPHHLPAGLNRRHSKPHCRPDPRPRWRPCNYGVSQLNHAMAERPTGSIFKPFVYATAYNTSLNGTPLGDNGVFTALTRLNDDEQDFGTADQPYTPGNFEKGEYPGMVTAVEAIEHSLNIATISLAQQVGYENVAALARASGITNARATPSVAIGTYNATPLDMSGAYTVFANGGVHIQTMDARQRPQHLRRYRRRLLSRPSRCSVTSLTSTARSRWLSTIR